MTLDIGQNFLDADESLFMEDLTEDLTQNAISNAWKSEDTDAWDNLPKSLRC